ncbi:heavy-metal-associated domain-containing protein [Pusillimonas sp. MFBS29]|uniref:heavy-metal-associated domain-containing protein n=1 Tax=Pusillimonas sp. MFBS29 TaxID=2886690 RepID=UPI001D11C67E|nr:heavy-metal-associated domain-containing protein [Pusillimonas sp. MFBS29]MCC2595006.1 heavy-metal-associated domain-containing protein [Pusillimonas sp. MFBS29]
MKKVVFNMEPFTCPSCVKKIENTVGKVNGVSEVKVMFNSGRVRAEFDESRTDADTLESMIVRLGYPVLSKKVL